MHIGIDAANLREGGGITHLRELLAAADPVRDRFGAVTVWSNRATLAQLPQRPWLHARNPAALERGLLARSRWQARTLAREASGRCDVLFVPGGTYAGAFRPFVTMCRNMLMFDRRERARFGLSVQRLKFELLRQTQRATFQRADGLILLTEQARMVVVSDLDIADVPAVVIPHGVDRRLLTAPRPQRPIGEYSEAEPFRLLYVSKLDLYKHQWHVADAVARLRRQGLPVTVTFVGGAYGPAGRRFEAAVAAMPDAARFIDYRGAQPRPALDDLYRTADAFVFASSCENLPNILIEAMAAGLPIAAADRAPMPSVLGPDGVYFDPESPASIAGALATLVSDVAVRERNSRSAYARAQSYSWDRCAQETFAFLGAVASGGAGRLRSTGAHA